MYTWTFGDSSSSVFGRGFGFFQQVTHAYSSSGSYIVTVRAANSAGSESATLLVHVGGELELRVGQLLSFLYTHTILALYQRMSTPSHTGIL